MAFNIMMPRLFNKFQTIMQYSNFHTLNSLSIAAPNKSNTLAGGAWSILSTRTNIRNHFPRAKETKRIKVHGWLKRLSTLSGRRTLMRRILKGRHVLSH